MARILIPETQAHYPPGLWAVPLKLLEGCLAHSLAHGSKKQPQRCLLSSQEKADRKQRQDLSLPHKRPRVRRERVVRMPG